jgi:restriction system protein
VPSEEEAQMAVPDYQSFMRPLLVLAADGNEHGIKDAIDCLARQFGLSDEDRSEVLPSGLSTVLANRVSWAKTYLMKRRRVRKDPARALSNYG